jgi:hypothetical protein
LVVALVEQEGVCRPLTLNLRHLRIKTRTADFQKFPRFFGIGAVGKPSALFYFHHFKMVKINHGVVEIEAG